MSFDDLFPLLLFIIFIVLPMLNRMQQRGRGRTPPPGGGRPGAPGQPPAGQPPRPAGGAASAGEREAREREARSATGGAQRGDEDPFAELAKRLEEARRRVREAGSGQRTDTAGSAGSASAAPAGRTIASAGAGQTARPAPRPALQPRAPRTARPPARDPFPKARPKPAAPWGQRTLKRPQLKEDAPALEVERRLPGASGSERQAQARAREVAQDLVSLDFRSIRRGVLWHMILSGPVAHRNRRKPSPPASR